MAINKESKRSPQVFIGASSPNTLKIMPSKIGDLFVDTTNLQLYFSFGMAGTQWGTCGTAGG
jgi:hypothetical protein